MTSQRALSVAGALVLSFIFAETGHSIVLVSSNTFGASSYADSIIVDASNNAFVSGMDLVANQIWLARYNASLSFVSSATAGVGFAQDMVLAPQGNMLVTGSVTEGALQKAWTGRYDSNLVLLSSHALAGCAGACHSWGRAVEQIGSNVVMVGWSTVSMIFGKYDSSLIFQSSATFAATQPNWATAMSVDSAGKLYVAGEDGINYSPSQNSLQKFDASFVQLSSAAPFQSGIHTQSSDVLVINDNEIWNTSFLINTGSKIVKYDANLNVLASLDLTGIYVHAIATDTAGNFWFAGEGWIGHYTPALVRIDTYTMTADAFAITRGADGGMWASGRNSGAAWIARFLESPSTPALSATATSTGSIIWSWNDVASETAFRIISPAGANLSGDLAANTVSWAETGLSTNTSYTRHVVAVGAINSSTSSAITRYSLAAPVTGFVISAVGASSITVVWQANGNPAGTTYQPSYWSDGSTTTLSATSAQTATVTGLIRSTTYYFTVRPVNGDGILAAAAPVISTSTLPDAETQTTPPGGSADLSVASQLGLTTVDIPVGAFAESVTVTLSTRTSFPGAVSPSGSLRSTGMGFEITLDKSLQPALGVRITVAYTAAAMSGFNKGRLLIARFDTGAGIWVPLVSSADSGGNTVTAVTNHFSIFQVMESVPAESVSAPHVFPNPFRPARGHRTIIFTNLPALTRLRAYSATGKLVREFTANAAGMATWDGNNYAGGRVASGVYFVFAQGNGSKTTFNVAIQR